MAGHSVKTIVTCTCTSPTHYNILMTHGSSAVITLIFKQQQPLLKDSSIWATKTDLLPTDTDITAMEVYIEVMRPLVENTKVIGGEKRVTVSAVRPFLHKFVNKHIVVKPSDAQAVLTDEQTR